MKLFLAVSKEKFNIDATAYEGTIKNAQDCHLLVLHTLNYISKYIQTCKYKTKDLKQKSKSHIFNCTHTIYKFHIAKNLKFFRSIIV